jgi:formate/nitrite transporter FocA (FNT family)
MTAGSCIMNSLLANGMVCMALLFVLMTTSFMDKRDLSLAQVVIMARKTGL